MQHRQSFAGLDNGPCVEFHANATLEKNIQGDADAVMAGNWLATRNQDRAGLVEGSIASTSPMLRHLQY
jgi:hypothetical protein